MNILKIIGNLIGLGKSAIDNRAKQKQLEAEQRHEITKAQTKAQVDRILSNTDSDNQIDLITAQNKKYTLKDEVVTYLFLVPVFVATLVPFISAFNSGDWSSLNNAVKESYLALDELPQWYKWILALIVIDVLGFRSFMRKVIDNYINKTKLK